ncbi:MAG: DUF2975 domain-containing protein [Gracilimonas sp.]|uniref:DUF2975 domain-containing protein n=1 Tax=Gracilimonas TaxID=649462 RepID=UPI001B0595F2|nr:DUF2975 domain-containing protein [Gracilimonas sp.]MBO6584663.1 DUF2975 domain-containing protein [Gracilimonas sp.]MBO6616066.1 DUF2975 domain-containing protein [Gracilimonas sp.]
MKLRKDWSLAYLLLYICQIGYWLIIISVALELFISFAQLSGNHIVIRDVSVNLELRQFEEYNDIELDNIRLNIPERMTSDLQISGPYEEVKGGFYFFNGLKLYENTVFFLMLFLFSKVLRNVAEGDPFHAKNPSYLYMIGWTLIISSLINISFQFLNMGHFISLPLLSDLSLPEGIDITSLDMFGKDFMIAGIFNIVLGYVFKEGARIYEEQKLTV